MEVFCLFFAGVVNVDSDCESIVSFQSALELSGLGLLLGCQRTFLQVGLKRKILPGPKNRS
jgi:hypothetical protein